MKTALQVVCITASVFLVLHATIPDCKRPVTYLTAAGFFLTLASALEVL